MLTPVMSARHSSRNKTQEDGLTRSQSIKYKYQSFFAQTTFIQSAIFPATMRETSPGIKLDPVTFKPSFCNIEMSAESLLTRRNDSKDSNRNQLRIEVNQS
jgi:hypothetical protein